MLINWFTVLAQIVNFLILVYLLKRFLYGPIIRAMQEREKKIAKRLQDAENKRKEAGQRFEALEDERRKLLQSKEEILRDTKEQIKTWRDNKVEQLREQIRQLRQAWIDGVESDKQKFIEQLKQNLACQTLKISRKTLSDLAGEDLEHLAIRRFADKIQKKAKDNPQELAEIHGKISVRSGFEMDAVFKEELGKDLKSVFPAAEGFEFDVNPDIGFGIELVAGDWKLAWNLSVYLEGLEEEILRSLAVACGGKP